MKRTDYAEQLAAEITRRAAQLAGSIAGAAETTDDATRHRLTAAAEDLARKIARDAAEIAGGEYRPDYNGRPNRETWSTALWIGNDPGTYAEALAITRQAFEDYETPRLLTEHRATMPEAERLEAERNGALRDAADALRDWWTDAYQPDEASPLSDAWTYVMGCVDWRSIAEGYAEGMTPGAPSEDEDDNPCLIDPSHQHHSHDDED